MLKSVSKSDPKNGVLVVPFWEGPKKASSFEVRLSDEALFAFLGKRQEVHLTHEAKRPIVLLGLGKKEDFSREDLRRAYAKACVLLQEKNVRKAEFFPPDGLDKSFLEALAEAICLTNYRFQLGKKSDVSKTLLEEACIIGPSFDAQRIEKVIEGVHWTRDLVNFNADDKLERILSEVKKFPSKIEVKVFDKKRIEKEKMGLLLAVNRASCKDPCLLQIDYRGPSKTKEHIVFVGKGITYDTGGLSLKTTEGMKTMKSDMAGGAAILGAIRTAASLDLGVHVTGLIPLAENCIGSNSYKLGDVYSSFSGLKVEITNTDAEGRLVLADAIGYAAQNLQPTCIVDVATLTGAAIIALGEDFSAFFSKEESLKVRFLDASEKSGELLWPMPLYAPYHKKLKSDIADLVNSGGREGGAITAALFLSKFAQKVPWAHIDIAGPSYLSTPNGYNPSKATGYGVRLLLEFLRGFA